jgi:hypothetical protein
LREADDIETLGLLYRLTSEAFGRIQPPLDLNETCTLIRQYLLRCIEESPECDGVLRRYEAAAVLESWFDHLVDLEGSELVLQQAATAITELYLRGDVGIRDAIQNGFLEHLLEQSRLRKFFEHWSGDPRLRPAWNAALSWGKAHPGFVKRLREANSGSEEA